MKINNLENNKNLKEKTFDTSNSKVLENVTKIKVANELYT